MAQIRLPGEQVGTYSIAGLFFEDGVAEVDKLTQKQAYLLGALLGADLPDDVEVLEAPKPEDQTPPAPEEQAPSRSTADDLAAMAAGVPLSDVIAEPQAPPAPEEEPAEEPQATQEDDGSTPGSDDAADTDTTPETGAEEDATAIPDAPESEDAPADQTPEPISTSDDGSTITEPAVEPDPIQVTPADVADALTVGDPATDPVAAAAATDAPVSDAVDGGVAPANATVTGSTDTSAS